MTQKMASAEDIIIQAPRCEPTQPQIEALHALRDQVFRHTRNTDADFGVIYVYPDDFISSPFAVNHYTVDGTIIPIFGVALKRGLDCVTKGMDLEGAIKHEAAHAYYNTASIDRRLELTATIARDISTFKEMLARPDEALDAGITRHFGSAEGLNEALARFEGSVAPLIGALRNRSEILKATPERMAVWIENEDEKFAWIKQNLSSLPDAHELRDMHKKIVETMLESKNAGETLDPNSPPSPPRIHAASHHILEAMDPGMQYRRLRHYSSSFSKGMEYAVDSCAQRHSENPESISQFIYNLAANHAKETNIPLDTLLHHEARRHPSDERRLARLKHIREHGVPPPDEELRPLAQKAAKPVQGNDSHVSAQEKRRAGKDMGDGPEIESPAR